MESWKRAAKLQAGATPKLLEFWQNYPKKLISLKVKEKRKLQSTTHAYLRENAAITTRLQSEGLTTGEP